MNVKMQIFLIDRKIKKMLFTFLIASLFNLFTLELLVNQKLTYINQANEPLGNDMSAIMVAYNSSRGAISGSMTVCNNKLDCLQKMCTMKQLNTFNRMMIYLHPGLWSNKCNLNVTDSINVLFKEWRATCLMVLIPNLMILIAILIIWVARLYNHIFWHIMCLFTFPLFLSSAGGIIALSSELINTSSGFSNHINNIAVLCSYFIFMVLFLIKIIWCMFLEHNKFKEIRYNNLY